MVGAAQERVGGDDRDRAPGELAQPGHQVADADDLFEDGVLQRRQDQDRDRPPHVVEVRGGDRRVQSEGAGREVQAQAGDADRGGEDGAAEEVEAGAAAVEADEAEGVAAVEGQEVERQRHGGHRERQAHQLPGEVQPGALGLGAGAVHGLDRLGQAAGLGEGAYEAHHGPDRRGAEGQGEDDDDLAPYDGGRLLGHERQACQSRTGPPPLVAPRVRREARQSGQTRSGKGEVLCNSSRLGDAHHRSTSLFLAPGPRHVCQLPDIPQFESGKVSPALPERGWTMDFACVEGLTC